MLKNKQRSIYRRDEKDFSISSTIKKCAILCIAFFVFAIVFALLISLFFFNTENPTSKIRLVSLISIYISSFVCGMILSRISYEKQLISSLILGAMIFTVIFTISLFVKNSQYSVFWHSLLPVSTVIGAICAKKREKRRRHKRY